MKTKQSVYVITMTDDTYKVVANRKDIAEAIKAIPAKAIRVIYRAIPMAFEKVTTVRLVAVKSEASE